MILKLHKYNNWSLSLITVWLLLITVISIDIRQEDWKMNYKVFGNDGLSYYGYLPLTFIYKDIKMGFYDSTDMKFKSEFHSLPGRTPTGNYLLPTTMGIAYLISPFFAVSHFIASITDFKNDGYSTPYAVGLIFSMLFYLFVGLFFLRKFLQQFFSEIITSVTLIFIVLGTNLLYYATTHLTSHIYSFSLISVFIYLTNQWYKTPNKKNSVFIGFFLGLITLIRPTNLLVLIFFIFWDVITWKEFITRILFIFQKYGQIAIMIVAFLLIWIPQFMYWKTVAGSFLFWSYGNNASFFFNNPQIINVLFSYRKGWLLYTPTMIFALAGIPLLWKYCRKVAISMAIFVPLFIYIMSSWWSWWYGSSFSQRPMIDIYAILAIPFAAFLKYINILRKYFRFPLYLVLLFFLFLNLFQTWQYKNWLIDSIRMTKKSYWLNFLKTEPHPDYKKNLVMPSYAMAHKGKYYTKYDILEGERLKKVFKNIKTREDSINYIKNNIRSNIILYNFVKQKAEKRNISVDSMINLDAEWLYNQRLKNKKKNAK